MRQKNIVEGVGVFVVVAETGSFSAAAKRLGISPSAVSQAIRSLEARLGAPLLRRSTRSVSLTDIGADYLDMAAPALSQLHRAADEVAGRGGQPGGSLRLTMSRAPFDLLLAETLVAFQEAFPQVDLEIAVEARMVDIVQQGFDAGLRYGGFVDKDMVAIPVAPPSEAILVAAPDYLRARSIPATPDELPGHRALMCRSQVTGLIKPWVLHAAGETVQVTPPAATVVHDLASQIELAARGMGIVSTPVSSVAVHLSDGRLVRVLPGWSTPLDALYLYFPSRRHQSAALRAFVAFMKERPHSRRD
jgi:DNA-binding transcriptional LysR family regulator